MTTLKKVFKAIAAIISIFLLYVIVTILYATITDFQPEAQQELQTIGKSDIKSKPDSIISFITWNIGFGGLGEETTFFYDADGTLYFSKPVTTPKAYFDKNQAGIEEFVSINKADFYLFQEVDTDSKRSYHLNQFEAISDKLPDYNAAFAKNYDVKYVPLPVFKFWDVMGGVEAGLATYSKYTTESSTRFQFPGNYGWPTRVFQLDRCFLSSRIKLENGKELVVINTHNSAYDKGGTLKAQQMAFLKDYVIKEYEKGNYIVVGGDWNASPPNFKYDTFYSSNTHNHTGINVPYDLFPEDWLWVYDTKTATNRSLSQEYKEGENFTALIDFYLISPNLKLEKVRTINQSFKYSDHQPVYLEVKID